MEKMIMTFFLGAGILLCTVDAQAVVVHSNQRMVSHPTARLAEKPIQHGHVDLNEFHGRHPEALPREGKTGKGVGCTGLPYNNCATRKVTVR